MITIRPATIDDTEVLFKFIQDLAIYEKAAHEVLATPTSLAQTLFAQPQQVFAKVAELNGEIVGSAIYFYNYSTWLAKPGLYLEDLYVTPECRGKGAGLALLKALAQEAVNNDCPRFEWSCLDWNTPSREFYQSIGAVAQEEWVGYRMSGTTLTEFAK